MTKAKQSPEQVQQQLEEKDHLIQALTERLSDVAEQLDRQRRTGPGGGGRSSGQSEEMLEQQQLLFDNLSTMLECWDGVQPRDAFGRIEARLDDLRELVESAVHTGVAPRNLTSPRPAAAAQPQPQKSDQAAKPAGNADEKPSLLTGWEAMKAQLLQGDVSNADKTPPSITNAVKQPPVTASSPIEKAQPTSSADVGFTPIDDADLPQPLDFATAERPDLERAIETRDRYISYLTRRLRNEQQRTREATDWEALNNAPEELQQRLHRLESDLEERLRIAEVDLSLERARISRVQSNTEEMQRRIEARLKSHNLSGHAQSDKASSNVDDAANKSWLSSLRRK